MIVGWTHAFRVAGWACVVVLAYLSLVLHDMEVRTTLPPGVEHLVAYAGTSGLLALGRRHTARIIVGLVLYSAALELLQSFSPGQHPGLEGTLWSGMGALVGTTIMNAVQKGRVVEPSAFGADLLSSFLLMEVGGVELPGLA
jgi:hypothetical protein